MRREFSLPEEDVDFLDSSEWEWETIVDGNNRWLLINDFSVPNGYNLSEVTAAIQILSGYPTSQLDMVYFHPALQRKDNFAIGQANVFQTIGGVSFQRWSRHYQWKPGLHSLATHILAIEEWLKREFDKNPMRAG